MLHCILQARQVLQVFPHMPVSIVIDDLRVTRSVDFTIENILEGRLQAPPVSWLFWIATVIEDLKFVLLINECLQYSIFYEKLLYQPK